MKLSTAERRALVDKHHDSLSMARQCRLLKVCRSTLYRTKQGESALNLELMSLIDAHHLKFPFLGVVRMTAWLREDKGYCLNIKRVRRLYRLLNVKTVGPKPNTSKPNKEHTVYPYLLSDLHIERPNQVWSVDITYIPMKRGYLYLVAFIDLYSRFVVGWSLSNTMDAGWCAECLDKAIEAHGTPEIINTAGQPVHL